MDDLAGDVDHQNRVIMNAAGFSEDVINAALTHIRDKRIKDNARRAADDEDFREELEELAKLGNLEAQATLDHMEIIAAVKSAFLDPIKRAMIIRSATPEIRQAGLGASGSETKDTDQSVFVVSAPAAACASVLVCAAFLFLFAEFFSAVGNRQVGLPEGALPRFAQG